MGVVGGAGKEFMLFPRDMETGGRWKDAEETGLEGLGTEEEEGLNSNSSLVRLRGRLEMVWIFAGLGGTGGGVSEGKEGEGEKSNSSKLRARGLCGFGSCSRTEKSSDAFPSWRSKGSSVGGNKTEEEEEEGWEGTVEEG